MSTSDQDMIDQSLLFEVIENQLADGSKSDFNAVMYDRSQSRRRN